MIKVDIADAARSNDPSAQNANTPTSRRRNTTGHVRGLVGELQVPLPLR